MLKISNSSPLLLGSASPRRHEILRQLGIPHRVVKAHVDETAHVAEAPDDYLKRVVVAKRLGIEQTLAGRGEVAGSHAGLLVADTIVVIDGASLGKPRDRIEASSHLSRLVGRTHQVMTRFLLVADGAESARTIRTSVSMRGATRRQIDAYVASGEPDDKAGAYAIQGIGAFLVEGISGSYTNVVGLPASELVSELLGLGLLADFPLSDQ